MQITRLKSQRREFSEGQGGAPDPIIWANGYVTTANEATRFDKIFYSNRLC